MIPTIGALIVAIVVLLSVWKIFKTTLKAALIVGLVVFGVQVLTGVGPEQVLTEAWKLASQFFSNIGNWLFRWGNTNKPPSDFPKDKQSVLLNIQLSAQALYHVGKEWLTDWLSELS